MGVIFAVAPLQFLLLVLPNPSALFLLRVGKRLRFLHGLKNSTLFDPHSSMKHSNVLFVTLTYDVKRSGIRKAWEAIGDDFNTRIRNLRKKFGSLSYLRCWEASRRGYPHIHVLMIFHDYSFKVAFRQLKNTRFGFRQVYRIHEKEEFERSWHSFVDVQAIRKMGEGIAYVTKYMTKSKSSLQTLTLALCWLFKKRSFAISGDFYCSYTDMIKEQNQSMIVQTDLTGGIISLHVSWVKIGEKGELYSAKKLGITHNEWRKTITDRQILNEILT